MLIDVKRYLGFRVRYDSFIFLGLEILVKLKKRTIPKKRVIILQKMRIFVIRNIFSK